MSRFTDHAGRPLVAVTGIGIVTPLGIGAADNWAALTAGRFTSQALVRECLARIAALDQAGPRLKAVIELNPEALAQAKALDAERRGPNGRVRGPLHGLPVLLKDNIATGDAMATTAGSLALAGLRAQRDAFIAQRLREAGAVILGKTNLSEWANIRSSRSTSGWSSRGGQTRNPHVLDRNTSGSSSGSGAAVAAGLCPLAVGTETDGSIISPSNVCGIVGLKPTLGLVSRDGIIPIAASQDTAGPMVRQVRDAALLLQALAGADARDAATAGIPAALARQLALDATATLRADALKGARIGVVRASVPAQPGVAALFDAALALLKAQGAVLVDPVAIPNQDKYGETEFTALLCELKDLLPKYLREFQPDAPVRDLAGLIAWNRQQAARVMPHFGQELFEQAEATAGMAGQAYRDALATNQRFSRAEGLDALFAEHRLDAVVAPSGNLGWPIDRLLGDHYTPGGFTSPFAVAGYPHLTVPMGQVGGLPVGLSFGGLAWQDLRLLGLGYAYEQASRLRPVPRYLPTVAIED
jgi:amidase